MSTSRNKCYIVVAVAYVFSHATGALLLLHTTRPTNSVVTRGLSQGGRT